MLSSHEIKHHARESGFALVGLARVEPLARAPLERWLAQSMAASMTWMSQRLEERLDPARLWPGAKTVVALGACYLTRAHDAASPIALYAQGRDYHSILRHRLRQLRQRLATFASTVKSYAEVDTGPVMEKVWAERAGLGWIGKNGLLLTAEHGSRVLLAVLLLDFEVDHYDSPCQERCESCQACLQRCPTRALVSPGVVDARQCLSFQTIENRGELPEALRPHLRLAFGCEECQTVCPWNRPGHACDDGAFAPRALASLGLADLAALSPERLAALTRGTAVARARHLQRNALAALEALPCPALR